MIILYGNLRKKFGKYINAEVKSVPELMKAAEALRPGFRGHIQKDRKYHIRRGSEFKKAVDVPEEEIEMRFADTTWHVLPMPIGYSGAVRILIGVVLIAASWYIGGAAGWGWLGANAGYMGAMGASLVLSGVVSLLSPVPKMGGGGEGADKKASYIFDGPTNRAAAGSAVPLIYGFDVYVGSVFVSGGLTVERIVE
jgi:predicted phage tail protein